MATRNVVREDVVRVSWEVEDNPFGDIQRTIDSLTGDITDTVRDMGRLDNAAGEAADAIRDIGNAGRRVNMSGIDNATRDIRGIDQSAENAQQSVRKLAKTKMTELVGEIKDASKELFNMQEAADEAADKLKSGLGGAVAAIGVTAGVGATVDFANDYQKALNQIQAATGASTEEMEAYSDVIKNIYNNNYGEGLDDVAATVSTIQQQFKDLDSTSLQNITESAYMLQDTFDMDMGETLRGVQGLMTNMGLTAEEAFNYITLGAQNGLDKTHELGDNLAEYSQIWGQAGFSAEEMFTILQNGLDSGAYNLDKVNDFVKEFTISLSDGRVEENIGSLSEGTQKLFKDFQSGKATSKDLFNSIITDIEGMENEQEKLALASTLWSSLGEDNAMSVIESLNNVNDTYKDVQNTIENAKNIKYDDMGAALKSIGRTLQTEVLLPLVNESMPAIMTGIERLKQAVTDFSAGIKGEAGAANTAFGQIGIVVKQVGTIIGNVFQYVANNLDTIVPIVGALVAAFTAYKVIMTAIAVVQKVKMAIDIAQKAVTLASTAAQWGLNASFLACPITWIIAGIVALIAIIVLLVKNWDTVKQWLSTFWEWWKSGWSSIVEFFKGIWNSIINAVSTAVTSVINFVKENWQGLLLLLVNPFVGAFKLIYDNCEGFRNFVNNIFSSVKEFISNAITNTVNFVKTGFTNMVTAAKTKAAEIKTNIVNKFNEILNFFKELPSKFLEFGHNIMSGLVNGIKEKLGAVKDTITGAASNVTNWFKDKLGINSPSKITTEMGMYVTQGLEVGMTDELSNLKVTASNVGQQTLNSVQNGTGMRSAYSGTSVSSLPASGTSKTVNQTNNYSPEFHATFYTNGTDRDAKSKFKKWFDEAMDDYFSSADRRNPQMTEV